jgi:predicted  nucleic acid-binding Zn-ribbon protein
VTEQVNEFEQLSKTLEENNDSIKSNKEFKDLQLNVKSIRDMMLQANESNTELHRHMTTIIEHLKILHSPLEQLEKTLPIITELDGIKILTFFVAVEKLYFLILQMHQINQN